MLGLGPGAPPATAPSAEMREALEVKNTFIDVNRRGAEGGSDIYKRQVSEPAPSMLRQLSGQAQSWRPSHVDASVLGGAAAKLLEEAEIFDDDENGAGCGQALGFEADDPGSWLMGCRGFGRQETEQVWPSWPGFATDLPEAVALAAAMGIPPPDLLGGVSAASMASTAVAAAAAATAAAAAVAAAPAPFDAPACLPCGQSSSSLSRAWEPKAPYAGSPTTVGSAAAGLMQKSVGPPSSSPAPALAAPPPPSDWAGTTTVMMRNLPNKYTQAMLIEELSSAGFEGAFDFLYLPIDPETHANRGYAFLNLLEPGIAWMMKNAFEGRRMSCFNSDKVVSVAPAALQGFDANYAHYSSSRVNRGDPSARPLFLRSPGAEGGGGVAVVQGGGGGGGGSSGNGGRGARRRGGRRGTGSLIDMAIRQQQKQGHDQPPFAQASDQMPLHLPPQVPRYNAQPPRVAPWDPDKLRGLYEAQGAGLGAQGMGAAMQQGLGEERPIAPKFCPYCGGRASSHFNFCSFCGSSLNLAPS